MNMLTPAIDSRVKPIVGHVPAITGSEHFKQLVRIDNWAAMDAAFPGERQARAGGAEATLIPVVDPDPTAVSALPTAALFQWFQAPPNSGRMEKLGLIVREECTEDARGAMVRMTDTGRAAIEGAAPGHVAATRRHFFDLLSNKEVDLLTAVFDRVLANLDPDSGSDRRRDSEGRAGKPKR